VVNMGNVALSNVNVVDNLAAVFTAPATFSVTSVASGSLPVNNSFNGTSSTSLLAAGATLAAGQTATITLVVHAHSGGNSGPTATPPRRAAPAPARRR
jgi:hypothetical protein